MDSCYALVEFSFTILGESSSGFFSSADTIRDDVLGVSILVLVVVVVLSFDECSKSCFGEALIAFSSSESTGIKFSPIGSNYRVGLSIN